MISENGVDVRIKVNLFKEMPSRQVISLFEATNGNRHFRDE